jgi:small subunit ribosomal protein S21
MAWLRRQRQGYPNGGQRRQRKNDREALPECQGGDFRISGRIQPLYCLSPARRGVTPGTIPTDEEVIQQLSEVKVREGETFESALRRFNKKIKQNGVLSEVRRREHYEKPSVRRKKKLVAARKRRSRGA